MYIKDINNTKWIFMTRNSRHNCGLILHTYTVNKINVLLSKRIKQKTDILTDGPADPGSPSFPLAP